MYESKLFSTAAVAAFALLFMCLGCHKKDVEKASKEKAPAEEGAEAAEEAKEEEREEESPAAPSEEAAAEETSGADKACQEILDGMWKVAAKVLTELGVENVEGSADRYKKQGGNFLKRCVENLTDEQRDCLRNSQDPLFAMVECGVSAIPPAKRPHPPSITGFVPGPERPSMSEEEGKAILATLAGTWNSAQTHGGKPKQWIIAADGALKEVRKGAEDREYRLEFNQKTRATVHTTATSRQTYAFLLDGKRRFYVSSNLVYDAIPIADVSKFVLEYNRNLIMRDGDTCRVYSSNGVKGEIECELSKKSFTATFTLPDSLDRQGNPIQNKLSYSIVDGHFVDGRMELYTKR